jgi:hypothetical protein
MSNFIVFGFGDNDFHAPLAEAVQYVVDHKLEELSLETYRTFVLRGMVAFNSIRRIDEFALRHEMPTDYEKYFADNLRVYEVRSLDEIRDGAEGYVYDKNLGSVTYFGY